MLKVNNLNDYISNYQISKVRLLESTTTTRARIQSIDIKENLALIVTAVKMVSSEEGAAFFSALMNDVHETTRQVANEMYNNAELVSESLIPLDLLEELKLILMVGKAEERGYLYDEKKNSYTFNANAFAKHFIKRCHVRSTKDGRLFLYNRKGVFEELSEVSLGKVLRTIMHEGRWNSWKSPYEAEVVKVLQREAITVEEMNTNRNYINVRNGMLSLTTFTLYPHSPEFLSTVQIPIEYNPNATAPHFMSFMKDITIDDSQLINVHQELVGYWLTVETKAEKAVYYYGGGANGKSVMASIVTALVGEDNVSSVPLSEFSQTFGMENLIGKSLNIAAENEMGGKALKTENFKAIVSGDNITINIKYRPAISYRPYCRLVFLVNNLPDSSDVTEGYFRKIIIVPFPRTFKKEERNVELKNELLKELPGILNWAIQGLKRLRSNNYQFSECKAIKETESAYHDEQNPVREFFHSHVVQVDGSRTKQSDFYNMYSQWLTVQGIDDKGTKSRQVFWRYFKVILDSENIPIVKKKVKGTVYYDGIKLIELGDLHFPTIAGVSNQF
ncbi:DNA primase family protein [Bacillus velezensis]|uniref:DNA primase family protein n=1 Tax=Bacillus velezensis TaxID=492670 RepID=UPI00136454C5|nr:phage/plasmid primase, P4 family [Bacillus velezensis]MCE4939285.1 phage/plasmid primase, P4 family [Bacillus velezensis]MDH3074004.1 phage/plasmid primase, P4 family [Bacillus velezensis]MDH3084959.1 phage/plasmid primase, P4 family [Bacillus velezensis]MDH3105621.1 phage/plasmid primase, P4 family [Bacillus velezensis]MDH3137124.1 phage/plasmid primase, P4 family [Bacillus velezensis]